MNKFFATLPEEKIMARAFFADSQFVGPFKFFEMWNGHAISDWDSSYSFKADSSNSEGMLTDVLLNSASFLIFSEKLRRLLESAGINDLQYLPTQILDAKKRKLAIYYVINILQVIPALDRNRSEITYTNKKRTDISWIPKVVFKEELLEGVHIFRLKEYPVSVYISEKFKTIFLENKCTGWEFREV